MKVMDAQSQPAAFAKGDIDIMTTPASLIPLLEKQYNLNVRYFWPMARWNIGAQILVPTNSPYNKVEDLKGKKVVMQPLKDRWGSEQVAIFVRTNTKIQDYFQLSQSAQADQDLVNGLADAAFIEAPLTVPLLQSGKFRAIFSIADGFKDYFKTNVPVLSGGYIARTDFIRQNPDFIVDWIEANQDIWAKYQKDPNSVIQVAAKQSGLPVEQLNVVAQVLGLKDIPLEQQAVVADDIKIYQDFYKLLQQVGFSEMVPDNIPGVFLLTKDVKRP
jgi:ABC-type nitrate/sulfonate/bicarbonate transport system substrate-binding protein